jgi:hypothetical protein
MKLINFYHWLDQSFSALLPLAGARSGIFSLHSNKPYQRIHMPVLQRLQQTASSMNVLPSSSNTKLPYEKNDFSFAPDSLHVATAGANKTD